MLQGDILDSDLRCVSHAQMLHKVRLISLWVVCLFPANLLAATPSDYLTLHQLSAEELRKHPDVNSTRVQLVLAAAVGRRDIEAGLQRFADLAVDVTQNNDDAYRHAAMCGLHVRNGEIQLALQACASLHARVASETLDPSVTALAYDALGALAARRGHSEDALDMFEAGLDAAAMAGDRALLALLFHNRSVPLMDIGLSDLAVRSIESAQEHLSKLPADAPLPYILHYNLALIQARRGSHEAALKQYAETIELFEAFDQPSRLFIATTQVAKSLTALGRAEEAIAKLQPWVDRKDIVVATDSRIAALRALGDAHRELGNFTAAGQLLNEGLLLAQSENNPLQTRHTSLSLVELDLERGSNALAIERLEELLRTNNDPRLEVTALRLLANAHASKGNFAAAWEYQSNYMAADQAIRNKDFDNRLAALTSLNEKNQLRQALRTSRAEEEAANMRSAQSRTLLVAGFVGLGLISLLGVLFMRRSIEQRRTAVQAELYEQLEETVANRTQDLRKEMARRLDAEKASAEMEKRLIEDDKLRSIGQLTGGVAHDFNNLLTVIALSSDLLRNSNDSERESLLDDIERASESGQAITQSLMAYARQQTLQPEAIELDGFLHEYAALFKRTLGDGIRLEMHVVPAAILADPGQLTTALFNLLFNAREAMDGSGTVSIRLENDGAQARIRVADDGPGMTEAVLERATEPFFTTKAEGGGSGLGLSMTYGFVKQSGGDVSIHSQPGTTEVVLSFPIIEPTVQAIIKHVDIESTPPSEARALVVDDQPDVRNLCHAVLERMDIEVVEAMDGHAALDLLARDSSLDLLITDMLMPGGMTGLDLISAARQSQPDLPVILISGGQVAPPENCIFLPKPFKLKQMQNAVLTLLNPAQTKVG